MTGGGKTFRGKFREYLTLGKPPSTEDVMGGFAGVSEGESSDADYLTETRKH